MCRIVVTKLQCKKANCTNIYGSFRDEEESEYCEYEGSDDPQHQVRQQTRTEKGDEYCLDCEASMATRRLNREINQEQAQADSELNNERDRTMAEQSRQREEDERRGRESEEYRRTGRWPGVNMQSGFFTSRGHNSRRGR